MAVWCIGYRTHERDREKERDTTREGHIHTQTHARTHTRARASISTIQNCIHTQLKQARNERSACDWQLASLRAMLVENETDPWADQARSGGARVQSVGFTGKRKKSSTDTLLNRVCVSVCVSVCACVCVCVCVCVCLVVTAASSLSPM